MAEFTLPDNAKGKTIDSLTANSGNIATDDLFAVKDVSASATKKVTMAQVKTSMGVDTLQTQVNTLNTNTAKTEYSSTITTVTTLNTTVIEFIKVGTTVFGYFSSATTSSSTLTGWTSYAIGSSGTVPSAYRPKVATTKIISQQNGEGAITIHTDGSINYRPHNTLGVSMAFGGSFFYTTN